ncbi:MAG: DUF4864 domain-containing protein [Candidatus Aminicenantia bacterium]
MPEIIIGVIVFVAIVVVPLALFLTKGNVNVVEKELSALKKRDYHLAYSLASKEFQNIVYFYAFREFMGKYPYLTKNKSHSFTEKLAQNNIGTLKVILKSKD